MTRALDAAIARGDAAGAWDAARQVRRGTLDLDHALAILVLLSTGDPDRYESAAERWLQRWQAEFPAPTQRSGGRLRHALDSLPDLEAVTALSPLSEAYGWEHASQALNYLYPTLRV